ncbi:hypothetical protein OROGR_017094 [Orobanche gracilis]
MNGDNRRRVDRKDTRISMKQKLILSAEEKLETKFGFDLFTEGKKRLGWLLTFASSSWEDQDTHKVYSCVDLYFVCQDGSNFKAKYKFRPYFYAATKDKMEMDVDAYLRRQYEGQLSDIQIVEKDDLDLKNHLSGLRKSYLKISFDTVQQLMQVKNDLMHVVERNQEKFNASEAYESIFADKGKERNQDFIDCISDLREYDVPYHIRFAIDKDVRSGLWYDVSVSSDGVKLERRHDLLTRAEVHVCAFDIETTKRRLIFPDAEYDFVMMISYMVDGKGYLIINREYVGEDIEDLEYTPKSEFEGCFKVTNVKNEEELIKSWFAHMTEVKPGIYVTYNGDLFDWPFMERRAARYGLIMKDELGFECNKLQGECCAKFACHLDCMAWVKRDSYLPQGSHGLKLALGPVTKAKLGYDPLEVNPEDMVRFAKEKPQMMASYSVSDAVSTYYLYMTYVHPFIFSLATIIPMPPDEVLRKGSGTLCEMLLMVEAYVANVVCPNKHRSESEKFHNNYLLESETYIGGHVKCLETGVFRSDLPTGFELDPSAFNQLIENLDRDLQYAIKVGGKMDFESVLNYDAVKESIMEKLVSLRDEPTREECPLIYHLDVVAMYPNIILTNRLQPPSIVTDEVCTACDFNRPGKTCLRKLEWSWRGETYTAKRSEYFHLKRQIESEVVVVDGFKSKRFLDLPKADQQLKLKERLKKYCQKVYKRVLYKPPVETREAGICMRENAFYVDTVRSLIWPDFESPQNSRDDWNYPATAGIFPRSLEMKSKTQQPLFSNTRCEQPRDRWLLVTAGYHDFNSNKLLQSLRPKSFQIHPTLYGVRGKSHLKSISNTPPLGFRDRRYEYKELNKVWKGKLFEAKAGGNPVKIQEAQDMVVLYDSLQLAHKCSRWYSMEMAGVVTHTGSNIIQNACKLVEKIGRPLELDTDGIWCLLPRSFPENFTFNFSTLKVSINRTYTTHSECSIEFEVDGPYKAMIIPASKEKRKLIKKRYAVFNDDGTLAELKGFEMKRRGELKLIKVFQAELFDKFLAGSTLEECYSVVASVANLWLDLLDSQGNDIADSELLDYISESSTMGKSLEDYGGPKSCAVTTAKRLAEFLGNSMVRHSGLCCRYVIACEPKGSPVSERAVPVAIFATRPDDMKFYLKKWCKISSDIGIRSIIDWSYYKQRLGSAIQKIITIPGALQKVSNPVPRVVHPAWVCNEARGDGKVRQRRITDMFSSLEKDSKRGKEHKVVDLEDFGNKGKSSNYTPTPIVCSYEKIDHGQNMNDIPMEDGVDRHVDYQGWLNQRKRKWKQVREKRKKPKLGGLDQNTQRNGVTEIRSCVLSKRQSQGRTRVNSYFERRELALTRGHWQPPVTEEFPGRPVNKILPHGHHCHNLIEVVIDEDQFRAESRKLTAHLADPEVEGIYETKVGLDFTWIVQIGCVCKVDKSAKTRNAKEGWSLSELHMKTIAECPYLESSVSFFYLYHSISEVRGVYLAYFPSSSTVYAVIVNPFQNKHLSPYILEKQFREACQALSVESSLSRDASGFKVDYVGNPKDAEKVLQRTISEFSYFSPNRDQLHGPTIALIECPNVNSMKLGIHALDDFPCVSIPSNACDSQYPALGWQIVAAKIGMQRCAAASRWLTERISLSRYSHVPVGNFELDWLIHTADIFFARALRDQQQILWVSDNGIPDLGGDNEEETCYSDEVYQPVLTYPGAYRKVTVELKIHHLDVTALLKSNQINEMEGCTLFGFDHDLTSGSHLSNEHIGLDEATSCSPAFRVLKQLIQRYLADAVSSGNIFADAILQHLYRWLCSPRSKLHDPALHRMLHKVMQKVYALLLSEFRTLGATIIFANFSKVILDTGKSDLSAAQTYCDSLLRTLQARDLFEWIELEPMQFWHSLLFMDRYNYGGIQAKLDQTSDNPQVDIVSSWNIAENLPKETQDHFILIVSEFMYLPWKFTQDEAMKRANTCTPSITAAAAGSFESFIAEHLRDHVRSYFTDKLLRIVSDTVLHMRGIHKSGAAQNNAYKGDPALEFIKHVCAVLLLDQNVQHDILIMRRNLLKYVRVREFAPEAQYQDCPFSFTLPDVICRIAYCNSCRDLDLCRDKGLLTQEWKCSVPQCGQPYDRDLMENTLLQIVRQRERLYHLQDLVCLKCKQTKAAHLAEHCGCAGCFCLKEEATVFKKKMEVLLNIGVHQKFELLVECVSWILEQRYAS